MPQGIAGGRGGAAAGAAGAEVDLLAVQGVGDAAEGRIWHVGDHGGHAGGAWWGSWRRRRGGGRRGGGELGGGGVEVEEEDHVIIDHVEAVNAQKKRPGACCGPLHARRPDRGTNTPGVDHSIKRFTAEYFPQTVDNASRPINGSG